MNEWMNMNWYKNKKINFNIIYTQKLWLYFKTQIALKHLLEFKMIELLDII